MGVIGHGIVFGLGYLCGRPEGRRRLRELRGRALELTRHPEVKRVQQRGLNLVQAQASAATHSLTDKLHATDQHTAATPTDGDSATTGDSTTGDSATSGDSVRTDKVGADSAGADSARVAADLHAALPGTHAPSPQSRTTASGFGGVTVAEDSHAVTLGLPADPDQPAPPVAPATSPVPADQRDHP